MTKLELIEKQINTYEQLKERIILSIADEDIDALFKSQERIDILNERLVILKQIKTIHESWRLLKKYLEFFPSDYLEGLPEEVITMTLNIDKKDYLIINEALHIKEDYNVKRDC